MPIFGAKSHAARGCASKLACGRRIDPAVRDHKIARIFGENVKRPVGADASVRPLGNDKFAATFRKKRMCVVRVDVGIDPYKRYADSPGCVRVCGCVPPGGQGRPPLRVHTIPHWCAQIRNIVLRGRGKPRPYVTTKWGGGTKNTARCDLAAGGFLILLRNPATRS